MRDGASSLTRRGAHGHTLVEALLGIGILLIVIVALLGAFIGQSYLNANARALQLAMNDATRIMEQIRTLNTGCPLSTPSIRPLGFESWEAWLNAQSPGKSLPSRDEFAAVTCQDDTGANYCGPAQMGVNEWHRPGSPVIRDPLWVTVSVGYLIRVFGGARSSGPEFSYTASLLLGGLRIYYGPDQNANRVIESQAMLSTLVTCR